MSEVENVAPIVNVPASVDTAPIKASPQVQAQTPAPSTEAPAALPAEEPIEEVEEDGEEDEEEDDQSYVDSDAEDEESVDDETLGEQAVEVAGPLSLEEEASEASQLAGSYGLNSTDDAINRVGHDSTRQINSTLSRYGELMSVDQEATAFYDTLSAEIEQLRKALNIGITKVIEESGSVSDNSGIDTIRGLMEDFLRTVLGRSIVHAEYRESTAVSERDVIGALSSLGRPLYWELKEESGAAPLDESADGSVAMEEDGAMDVDEDEEEEMENWEGKDDEPEDESHAMEPATFKRVVDVVNTWEGFSVSEQGYAVLQASVEDFLGQIVEASNKAAHFAGHTNKIGAEDVKFSQLMTQRH